MDTDQYSRFANLTFDDFRRMAVDASLSCYEKIGFPNSYREGSEDAIFADITAKLSELGKENKTVLDIGPGCSELPLKLIELCRKQGHKLLLVDSAEMLAHLPDKPFVTKIAGYYPHNLDTLAEYAGEIDVILSYSVLHYVFAESNIWDFLDSSLSLLSHGGEMMIGDVPNVSMRKRFFSSPQGVKFHQKHMQTENEPSVAFNRIERHQIDDAVVFSLLMRAREQGFDAYVVPQHEDLPMANRREDILIRRP